jgi:hypothetical protein
MATLIHRFTTDLDTIPATTRNTGAVASATQRQLVGQLVALRRFMTRK